MTGLALACLGSRLLGAIREVGKVADCSEGGEDDEVDADELNVQQTLWRLNDSEVIVFKCFLYSSPNIFKRSLKLVLTKVAIHLTFPKLFSKVL